MHPAVLRETCFSSCDPALSACLPLGPALARIQQGDCWAVSGHTVAQYCFLTPEILDTDRRKSHS